MTNSQSRISNHTVPIDQAQPLLHLIDAGLQYVHKLGEAPLNWALWPGEHWVVLGPAGSGKSTLLDTLAKRIRLKNGQFVQAANVHIELVARDYSFDWRVAHSVQFYQQRFNTEFVGQSPTVRAVLQQQLLPLGTVDLSSVSLPPATYPDDWLTDIATQVSIDHLLDQRLTSLSNGETRRVLLARSLLRRPQILLIDNPFAGLDTASRSQLHKLLNKLTVNEISLILVADERDVPTCITHRLHLAEPIKTLPTSTPAPSLTVSVPVDESFTYAVRMRNISVLYGSKQVLTNIDWSVRRGEKWALLGPNGSGKSTLLSLITADNPQAYANDFDLFDRRRGTGESIWAIKRRIGFVSPELHLYFPRHTSVWDVVASGLFDTMGLFRQLKPMQVGQVKEQLERLGLFGVQQQALATLSLGQQRWALLARALIKQPPLLILDEPSQGLDPAQHIHFQKIIEQLCQQNPALTLIYVTHYPDELPTSITHTLRLHDGHQVL